MQSNLKKSKTRQYSVSQDTKGSNAEKKNKKLAFDDNSKHKSPHGHDYKLPLSEGNVPEWYEELSEAHISHFRDLFDILEPEHGHVANLQETIAILKQIDSNLSVDVINKDKDGNHEIDFDEFLYMMVTAPFGFIKGDKAMEKEKGSFMEMVRKRQNLFFSAIVQFAMTHLLEDVHYTKTQKTIQVISDYTAGVRAFGLNDSDLEKQFRKLTEAARHTSSPYAQPLPFHIPNMRKGVQCVAKKQTPLSKRSDVNHHSKASYNKNEKSLTPQELDEKEHFQKLLHYQSHCGSILAKLPGIHQFSAVQSKLMTIPHEDMPLISSSARTRRHYRERKLREAQQHTHHSGNAPEHTRRKVQHGWVAPKARPFETPLPVIKLPGRIKKKKRITFEDIPLIRIKVDEALEKYYFSLRKNLCDHAWNHWDQLHTEQIPETLRDNFREVYAAYSPHKFEDVLAISPWIPSPAPARYRPPVPALQQTMRQRRVANVSRRSIHARSVTPMTPRANTPNTPTCVSALSY